MSTSDQAQGTTEARIRRALFDLCEGLPETVTGHAAGRRLAALTATADCTIDELGEIWRSPDESLGPFDELPAAVRQALALAGEYNFRELRLTSPAPARWLGQGWLAGVATRLLSRGWRELAGGRRTTGESLLRSGRRLMRYCQSAGRALGRRLRPTRFCHAPFILHLWHRCGTDIAGVVERYVGQMRPDPRLSPVYADPARRSESALVVGIDALRHRGRLYFIESNVNPGLGGGPGFAPGEETLCERVVEYAASRGRRRLDFYASNLWPGGFRADTCLSSGFEQRWRAMAGADGPELRLIDSPVVGSAASRDAAWITDAMAADTLAVIARDMPSPVSGVLGTKGRMEELLATAATEHDADEPIPFPCEIIQDEDLPAFDGSGRFPNLIFKNPTADMARGITLHKATRLPSGAGRDGFRAYEYLAPDPVHGPDGDDGEYASIFRIHLLLTVDGPRYLGARKDISPTPLPAKLADGPVTDASPFLANVDLGARSVAVSAEECELCQRFALRVGGILTDYLRARYVPDLLVPR